MDILGSCPARMPTGGEKVYKDDCVFCFNTPESEGGLYVCLQTFLGFCQDHVMLHIQKTGLCVFLHLKRERKPVEAVEEQGPAKKKPTRLAIGLEGGFDTEQGKVEYEEFNSVSVLHQGGDPLMFPLPCPELPMQVQTSVAGILAASSATCQEQALAWDGEKRKVTKHADTLKQLDNGVKVPPKGWICSKCDKVDNLWMNLTDGTILCGRKYYDGTGGNNHAVEYYEQTGFPLAVKLGTITPDGADVYSYDEDDMVEDPNLSRHLEHFGINIAEMKKTDRTMTELEIDLNMKVREWDVIQEAGKKLTPLFGPGYTGLRNLGNSCYMNSVMQVLFTIPEFKQRYVDLLNQIFQKSPPNPTEEFDVQMSKLGNGLLSGKYSIEPEKETTEEGEQNSPEQHGISPHMFKGMIGRGHAEFSTNRQQDAQEFFMHLLTCIDRNERTSQGTVNTVDCFRFKVEERVECTASGKVRYTTREETTWSLPIPLEAATNQDEMSAYEAKKKQMDELKQEMDPADIVRPRISLSSCISDFSSPEMVDDFYSPAINAKTTAKKTTRFSTFPEYLMVQMKKFTVGDDWVPKKLDVALEIPEELDLESLRGRGKQPGEEELPEDAAGAAAAAPAVQIDESVVAQLVDMGFPYEACRKAVYYTKNSGSEMAMNWVLEHMGDPDFNSPLEIPGASGQTQSSEPDVDESSIELIVSMGFTRRQAILALKSTNNNLERAADWIFSHANELDPLEDVIAESTGPTFKDGPAKYKLMAFISHMGTSTSCGHYVCHIMKEGRWVIFNDRKVALSESPPKELAYLYLYKRI